MTEKPKPRETLQREEEIKRDFSPPRWIWAAVISVIGVIGIVELVLIFFVLPHEWVMKVQTFNGTLVMTGGVLAFSITTLVIMFPLKNMTIYMVALYEDLTKTLKTSAKDQQTKGQQMLDKMERVAKRIEENVGGIPAKKRPKKNGEKEDVPPQPVGHKCGAPWNSGPACFDCGEDYGPKVPDESTAVK